MINETAVISMLIFTVLVLLLLSGYLFLRKSTKKKEIIDKIDRYVTPERRSREQESTRGPSIKHFFSNLAERLAPLSTPKKEEELSHRRRKLAMAGYRRTGDVMLFYGSKVFLAILFPVSLFLCHLLFGILMERTVLFVALILIALLGFYAPDAWVHLAIANRQEKIREGFPDALDLMVVCVEAGMGLDQAIKRISDEMKLSNKVISDEFGLMTLEMRAGRSRKDAMRNLGTRTGVEDVKSLVTLLIQTDTFGTSIAQALRVHSDTMRTKRRQRAEEIATKLPVKLLFPLLLFIFPALFVVVIGPGAIRIYRALIQTHFGSG